MTSPFARQRAAIALLFAASGATGLVYEVVWAKHLALALGSAAHAQAIVLAAFLGGLALGSWWWGPRADRAASALRLYAGLELGVAAAGAALPLAIGLLEAGAGGWPLSGRALAAAALLLPPTILMGGTLPALARHLGGGAAATAPVAWLYALNSAGAVAGALAAGFWLVPAWGLDGASWLTAALNAALALCGAALAAVWREEAAPVATEAAVNSPADVRGRRLAIGGAALSGFVALALEIVWIRILALVLGSTAYAFALMLATFVGGIAIGAALLHRCLVPGRDPLRRFAFAQLGVAVAVVFAALLVERLPYWFLGVRAALAPADVSFSIYTVAQLAICALAMLPPTIFLGMALPLAFRLAAGPSEGAGAAVGRVWAANTLGNVAGSLATTFVLMPALGLKGVLDLGAFLALALAGAATWLAPGPRGWRRALVPGVIAAIWLVQRIAWPAFDMAVLASGPFRTDPARWSLGYAGWRKYVAEDPPIFHRDDPQATVTVHARGDHLKLVVNGKVDASNLQDQPTQILLGQVPLLLHPKGVKDALVIGLGSGMTAGTILAHPVERVDVAEISPAVVEAAGLFAGANRVAVADRRLHVIAEDGLALLAAPPTPDGRYDVIVSEPSNPWMAGVGNLFTIDAYRRMAKALRPGGLAVQWFHLYQMDDASLQIILRSFAAAFPYVSVWQTYTLDLMVVGGTERPDPGSDVLARRMAVPEVAAELRRIGITRPTSLLMLEVATDQAVRRFAGAGPLHEMRRPLLEYRAPRTFWAGSRALGLYASDERLKAPADAPADLHLAALLRKRGRPLAADELAEAHGYQATNFADTAFSRAPLLLARWRRAFPADLTGAWREAQVLAAAGRREEAFRAVTPVLAARPRDREVVALASDLAYRQFMDTAGFVGGAPPPAEPVAGLLRRHAELDPPQAADLLARLGAVYHVVGDRPAKYRAIEQAVDLLAHDSRPDARRRAGTLLASAARTAWDAGDRARMGMYLRNILRIDPDNPAAAALAAETLGPGKHPVP